MDAAERETIAGSHLARLFALPAALLALAPCASAATPSSGAISPESDRCDFDDVSTGIVWAADQGADVINMSLGADELSTILDLDPAAVLDMSYHADAIEYARDRGVIVVQRRQLELGAVRSSRGRPRRRVRRRSRP